MVNIFSVPAFFIVLREVLEACLVVGIVLAYLDKVGETQLRGWVWAGATIGIIISLIFGVTFAVIFYVRGDNIFSGKNEKIFEGIVFLIAAGLLTWMIIWMQQMGRKMQAALEEKVEKIIDQGSSGKWGLFAMVFVQVLREGIETWIFLFGAASAQDDPDAWKSIPLPGILAIIVGLAASYALFRGLVELDVQSLFYYSSLILMAFAAGLTSHAFHELQEADWFGSWDAEVKEWYNARLWSTKACCNDKKNEFFAFMRALFGYQDTPTYIEIGTYFAYWIIIAGILLYMNWSSVRAARSRIANLTKTLTFVSLNCTFIAFIYVISNVTWHGVFSMTLSFLLSIVATFTVFDALAERISFVKQGRKTFAMITGVAFALLTLFILVIHIYAMRCDDIGGCALPRFYYAGLIFNEDWALQGRADDNNSWPSVAVLSVSSVVMTYFFGAMSFFLIVYSGNVDDEGDYIYDSSDAPIKSEA